MIFTSIHPFTCKITHNMYVSHILYCIIQRSAFVQRSHHLSVHGDDVSNEGALLHWCDVSVGDPVGQGRFRAAGHHGAGPTVGDEDGLVGRVLVSSGAVGYWGEV